MFGLRSSAHRTTVGRAALSIFSNGSRMSAGSGANSWAGTNGRAGFFSAPEANPPGRPLDLFSAEFPPLFFSAKISCRRSRCSAVCKFVSSARIKPTRPVTLPRPQPSLVADLQAGIPWARPPNFDFNVSVHFFSLLNLPARAIFPRLIRPPLIGFI